MRSRLALFVAFLAVLVGGVGIFHNITSTQNQNAIAEVNHSAKSAIDDVQYIQVWRAAVDLERGTPIDINNVEREQLQLNIALEEGISSDIKLDFSPSTLLNKNIKQGQLVLPEYQVNESDPRYIDLLITEGMEPYSLLVSTRNLVQGYIRPGTYVDLLAVSSPQENLADEDNDAIDFSGVNAQLILQNVKVLSIGGATQDEDAVQSNVSSEDEHQVVIVVEVVPQAIARLSIAQKTMHLEVYRSHKYKEPIFAEVRDVIGNYSGVTELRGSTRQAAQGEEL
ncbi:Flp pilus assembly protein CpaB [Vibrio owensii]|uniref:Flp pilus assembly protein CpaB n=1 Tax=Vibrio owensii TaxID=696485 RepID=UPI00215CE225|nr:Flp pilus assembly protein CpaB [Vibrio owensii]MCR9941190.1 Flp pilus assembly protein CpaB [Vibrio owensii]